MVTHNLKMYPNHKELASLQPGFLIKFCMSFDVTPPYSTGSRTSNTSFWIVVSHHPGNVIIISSNSPPDTDLGDQFIQPPAEYILQLISNLNYKSAKGKRLMLAIHQRCKLWKKALNLHQSAQLTAPYSNIPWTCR